MKKNSRANKGQFSIIAALLVAIILVAAVIMTYAAVRNNPFQQSPKVLSSIGEMNLSIKRILEFATGYYGSILQVTGNSTYANELTSSYLYSGFINIARSHPEWNPSFHITSRPRFSTLWFAPTSYSMGNVSVTYSLSGLGIEGVKYETSSLLKVEILETLDGQARLNVTREENKPYLTLGTENFFFYSYSYSDLAWKLVPPASEPQALSDGTYILQIPDGVDPAAYSIQVVDPRSIMVIAFFSEGSLVSGVPQYTYKLTWDSSLYSSLTGDTIVVEALQDGTLRWLGQELELSPGERPILPIPVKSFRVNQTIDGVNREVPFQVEDWGSNYRVPLGLSSKYSLFSSRNMIVFLVNHEVQEVTLWWDGRDTADQTPYATTNNYFRKDDPATGILTNEILTLNLTGGTQSLYVNSYDGTYTDWTETGSAPYLNNDLLNYISFIQQDKFGYETRGGNYSDESIENYIRGYRSTCTYGGNARSITVCLRVTGTSKRVRCAIYDTSYNLIAQTEERTIAGTDNWQTFNFAAPYPQLSAGTDYWLVAWGQSAGGVLEIYYDSGPSGVGLARSQTYNSTGFPNPLTSPTNQSRRYSIYCTYECEGNEGWFGFQDGTGSGTIESVKIQFECQSEGDDYFDFRVDDGTTTYGWYSITGLPASYYWKEYDLSSILNTWTKIRNAEIYVRYRKQGADSSTVYIRRCRLRVASETFGVTSTVGASTAYAEFLRINNEPSFYGADPAYVIYHGIVRDIIQQEAEWSGGALDCPNVYSQIVLTLPANATYYTYALRTIFVSSLQSRTITDLSAIQLSVGEGQALTENGTIGGMPITSNVTGLFYNFSSFETGWAHHWSEFIEGSRGGGIMFTDSSNLKLYVFDSIAGEKTGALSVISGSQTIEFNPVARFDASFTYPLDVAWHGAVVTFEDEPIYPISGEDPPIGLWVIVEYPPTVEVS